MSGEAPSTVRRRHRVSGSDEDDVHPPQLKQLCLNADGDTAPRDEVEASQRPSSMDTSPPVVSASRPQRPQAVIFTDLPPEIRHAGAFAAALKESFPSHLLTKVREVRLLRDLSGFAVRVEADSAQAFLAPSHLLLSHATVRLPRPPKTPAQRLQVTLDGVDALLSVAEVEADLKQQLGDVVLSVERFHRRTDAGFDRSQPLPRVRVTTSSPAAHAALCSPSFRLLGLFRVRATARKEDPHLRQCARCLGWDHRVSACREQERCLRCGEAGHRLAACQVAHEDRRCANCGERHLSIFRGCPAYRKAASAASTAANTVSTAAKTVSTASAAAQASSKLKSGKKAAVPKPRGSLLGPAPAQQAATSSSREEPPASRASTERPSYANAAKRVGATGQAAAPPPTPRHRQRPSPASGEETTPADADPLAILRRAFAAVLPLLPPLQATLIGALLDSILQIAAGSTSASP